MGPGRYESCSRLRDRAGPAGALPAPPASQIRILQGRPPSARARGRVLAEDRPARRWGRPLLARREASGLSGCSSGASVAGPVCFWLAFEGCKCLSPFAAHALCAPCGNTRAPSSGLFETPGGAGSARRKRPLACEAVAGAFIWLSGRFRVVRFVLARLLCSPASPPALVPIDRVFLPFRRAPGSACRVGTASRVLQTLRRG